MTGFALEKTTSSSRGEVEVFEQMTKTEAIFFVYRNFKKIASSRYLLRSQ
jgi:hypothetical protein